MATTTNYGWTTPDDTALVKDGAAAIRSLGSSIDTTTKNLNPSTTLGDIEYRSSTANTNTRLAIGTSGQVLTVSGGVPAWATASSGGMTQIASGNLSGTTVTISSIPSTYKAISLWIINISNTTGDASRMRLNGDTGSNYSWNSLQNIAGQDSVSYIDIPSANDNASWYWTMNNYASTTTTRKVLSGVANGSGVSLKPNIANGFYVQGTAAAISSITLYTNSTAFTGSYILYGVN
jgi:hypothetical protein